MPGENAEGRVEPRPLIDERYVPRLDGPRRWIFAGPDGPAALRDLERGHKLLGVDRLDILKIHSRKMNLTRGIDLKRVMRMPSLAPQTDPHPADL